MNEGMKKRKTQLIEIPSMPIKEDSSLIKNFF
jgi:hypothetical protein